MVVVVGGIRFDKDTMHTHVSEKESAGRRRIGVIPLHYKANGKNTHRRRPLAFLVARLTIQAGTGAWRSRVRIMVVWKLSGPVMSILRGCLDVCHQHWSCS